MTIQKHINDYIILKTMDEIVPKGHLVRKFDVAISFKFIKDEV